MMEEDINDTDAKLLYDAMSNNWRSQKAEREFEKAKEKYFYKYLYFMFWFLGFRHIELEDYEPTDII